MAQMHSYRRMRILHAGAMILLGLCSILETEEAHGQDFGIRDTVRYLQPSYQLTSCDSLVKMRLPIYLFCDLGATVHQVGLHLSAGGAFDTAFGFSFGNCVDVYNSSSLIDSSELRSLVYCDDGGGVCPGEGVAYEFVIDVRPGDSIHVNSVAPWQFQIGDLFNYWKPLGTELDTFFIVPTSYEIGAGDADASGFVTISDAVSLIQYIFAGGCAPFDLNAADPNADCSNTISDVVYLINYIFAGGPPPQVGCVGQ